MDAVGLDLKKYIPHTPGAIERPHLLEKLRNALQRRLTLISAPPGYGKTTIVSQFADQAPCPVVWHTVDERERDFPDLYDHFLSALEPLFEGICHDLQRSDGASPSELAMHIGDYLRRARGSDFIYVLDDVHHLDGMHSCESWLRTLSMRLPKSCHLIVISRTVPNLPYAEMVARSEIGSIGPQDLRLTEDEIRKVAEEMVEAPFLASHKQMIARLDGWPAGVFLALQPLSGSLTDAMLGGGQGPEVLFEALARPMLQALSPDLRSFLLSSSTLPYLTPDLCENMLRLPNSAEWLTLTRKRNLFLLRVSAGFEFHNLFRGFLQRELRSVNPDRFAELHLKAARWFEEIDDIEQAFDHYIAAGGQENALALAEKTAVDYFGQGKFETLLKWSAALGEAGVVAPILSLQCSTIHGDQYEYPAAESELQRAEQGFSASSDTVGLAKVRLQRAMIYRLQGKYQEAIDLAEEVLSLRIESLQGRALRVIGSSRLRLGDTTTAISCLEEAAKSYRSVGLATALSHLLQDLHFAYMRAGRLDEMGSCLQEVVVLRRKLGGASALALALNALGYYYHKRGNYREAFSTLEEGRALIAGAPARRSESYLLASLADLKRDLGLYADASLLYEDALHLVSEGDEPNLYSTILISFSTLRRWQGRVGEAVALAEDAFNIANTHNVAFETAMSEAVLWLARAEQDKSCEALERLRRAIDELHRQGAGFEILEVLSGCIYVAHLCGAVEAVGEYLAMAGSLVEEIGTGQSFVAEVACRPPLEMLVVQNTRSKRLLADLEKLREAQGSLGEEIKMAGPVPSAEAYSLRVLTLGQEQVERDGKVVSTAEWQAAAPRELFFYLLFNGPQTRSDIELVFWPESGPDQARALVHTTLHRARQAVGQNVILFEDELYSINPEMNIECDARRLETWTSQARLLSSHDARTEDLWRKAVAIYRGDFLRSLDNPWVLARREAYSAMRLSALIGLGHCARARTDLDAAVQWFSEAIAVDPYAEDNYRQVIRCYAQTGEKGKIQAWFSELKKILKDELDIDPSEETISMVRNIIGSA